MTAIDVWIAVAAFVLLTAGNAFFVAAEFSLVTVDRALVEEQAQAGDARARNVRTALKSLSFQLSGAQLGITITALMTGYLAEPAIAELLRPALEPLRGVADQVSVAVALVLATLISMLFGELLPKNAAIARPMPTARWAAPIQRGFSAILAYPIRFLNGSANRLVRRLGMEPQEELASARSPEELGLLAAISARAGALPRETAMLLQRTIRFGSKRAGEAMTPRVDVVGLEADSTVDDLLAVARETGHSRFPIYVDILDQILGVAHVIDALAVGPDRRSSVRVRAIAREPVLVPSSLDLDQVLARLHETDAELAIVVDEYGGTDGIISGEDLAEELVGEIDDEYDPPRSRTDDTTFTAPRTIMLVPGGLREDELAEQTGFHLPEGPYETLAGFLMARLGHIPREGEVVEYEGWTFGVEVVERRRIEQVQVRPPDDWTPDGLGTETLPTDAPSGAHDVTASADTPARPASTARPTRGGQAR